MSVDLLKNRDEIIGAWKEVLDTKTTTDWALFGYEGQSNCLKLISNGDGGLIELADELNSGKIMYAFVSVQDPKNSLTKYLLINWQGEGAPTIRKGTCANHIRDISKLLTGAHLTINARTDDDVETERIMEKISVVGSTYSFKENRNKNDDEQRGPVGTNYSRVIPSKEINSKDRDNFWKKEEEEERHRIELERERREQQLVNQEQDRRLREEREHKERELQVIESNIDSKEKKEKNIVPIVKSTMKPLNPPSPGRSATQADKMRQQRNREAKELIGSRVDTAKAIFTQNTVASQMSNNKAPPVKPIRNSIAHRINTLNNQQDCHQSQQQNLSLLSNHLPQEDKIEIYQSQNVSEDKIEIYQSQDVSESITSKPLPSLNDIVLKTNKSDNGIVTEIITETVCESVPIQITIVPEVDDNDLYSTIKRSPYTKGSSNSQVASPDVDQSIDTNNQIIHEMPTKKGNSAMASNNSNGSPLYTDVVTAEDIIYQDIMHEDGLRARALYDYQADDESEITFDPGDVITHIDQIDEGWWQGLGPDGTYGLFPANYVELIE